MIAGELGVSRVAIRKHIRDLKQDGSILEYLPKGYHQIHSFLVSSLV
ncbi:HTH domain-containing protein [Candidatus Sordicultor fermentans]